MGKFAKLIELDNNEQVLLTPENCEVWCEFIFNLMSNAPLIKNKT